jgi:8-oxo-dGTP pyrophosphatase MutT (NUDIX family)
VVGIAPRQPLRLDGGVSSTFAEALAAYRPGDEVEAVDVARVRAVLAGACTPGGGAPDPLSRAAPLHLTGSALIVHPPSGRVLLRWHTRQQTWLQVGGHMDPGELDPLTTALREAVEETGLVDVVPWPDRAIVHVAVVPVPASATEPAHEHADVRYVLATSSPNTARPENPAALLRWLPVDQARAATGEANLRVTLDRTHRMLKQP